LFRGRALRRRVRKIALKKRIVANFCRRKKKSFGKRAKTVLVARYAERSAQLRR